ncbi:hypothetical protein CcaverHIS002_0205430 [Cutaneotrichosporon cavernicola]|uniref:PEBP-like protein n=1 Tax=Cutaneotrichosporon cavernicola TaxID=279322 RepID=A0AA48IIH0_9TREE|nr:uncharacterized protein CcaverHIS019_0205400 [Cutaneotrichosporon cavernicola]BEI81383.1 hypothetical protein CcaverHIS002_0205430 [Cutaneotrichosporon cavernicola]BEI89178.1 hypothetical protein CcaverHIS019_0205400 [Cutaneotrichosporon cavernicola]BEI96954.1 hypothetical protein CcaverHIS631_0205430 [Cutaneotrichosporon cavernicola]BEJ04727.1 hypothetical protein CcaverHIS641_0205440 [Cutaneotrichosporon cavernicola]
MLFATLVSLFAVGALADLNAGEIAGLVENFKNADLSSLVGGDNFKPDGLLTGKFGTVDWTVGANLTANETSAFPSFFVNPNANSTTFANETQLYSAILVDAGVAGSNDTTNQTLHWLINSIHVNTTGGAPYALAYANGTTITEYAGPNPPPNVGPHRYVLGLFQQPADFAAPTAYSQKNTPVGTFNLAEYITQSKLGPLVAANYFTVANGAIPTDIPQTSAVVSSTISGYTGAAAIPTAAGAEGGGAGANGTGTASGVNPSDPAASPTGSGALNLVAPGAIVALVAGAAALF